MQKRILVPMSLMVAHLDNKTDGSKGGDFEHRKNMDCEQIQKRVLELVLSDFSKKEHIDDGFMSQVPSCKVPPSLSGIRR